MSRDVIYEDEIEENNGMCMDFKSTVDAFQAFLESSKNHYLSNGYKGVLDVSVSITHSDILTLVGVEHVRQLNPRETKRDVQCPRMSQTEITYKTSMGVSDLSERQTETHVRKFAVHIAKTYGIYK